MTCGVNFAPHVSATDGDASCTGTAVAPTAPPAEVCIYVDAAFRADELHGGAALAGFRDVGFRLVLHSNGSLGDDMFLRFTWAYTAPAS